MPRIATHEVTVNVFCPAPDCGSAIEQTVRISGYVSKATRYEPAEGPDVERANEIPAQCPACGLVFNDAQWKKLDKDADEAMARYDWYEAYEDMSTNWGEE